MNLNSQSKASIAVMLVAFVVLGAGCAMMPKKTGVERAEKTTTSMQKVDSDIKQANLQIDVTKASLDSLLQTGQMPSAQQEDVKAAFDTFSENADKMTEVGKNLNKHIDEMASRGNAYFQEWSKEGGTYTNPEIQKLSEERRANLSSAFRDMELAAAGVRANLNAYLMDVEEVQKYLSNDLTPQGIAAIIPVTNTLAKDGSKLKRSLAPVDSAIMQARAQLSSGGSAAGGGAAQQHDHQKNKDSKQKKK